MNRLANLETVTGAFLRDLKGADQQMKLADIEWTVQDLAVHLGEVHQWAVANTGADARSPRIDTSDVGSSADEVVQWYVQSRDLLLATLHELDPHTSCYTMSSEDKSVGFWHRRMLCESLVHLWDLRSAADPAAPPAAEVTAEVHADAVTELFDVYLPRFAPSLTEPLGGVLAMESTDSDSRWSIGSDWQSETGGSPAALVRGTAGELLLWAWNRASARSAEHLEFAGDLSLIGRFEKAKIRP